MELMESPLWNEVTQIIKPNNPIPPPLLSYRMEIKAGDKTVTPLKLISIDTERMFRGAFGDDRVVRFDIGAGDFFYDIYPHRADLMVMLYCETLSRGGSDENLAPNIPSQLLRGTLVIDQSIHIQGETALSQGREGLNLQGIMTIDMQLVEPGLERIRMTSVGGGFMNVKPEDILLYSLTALSSEMDLDDEARIKGVEMYPAPEKRPWAQVVVPHNKPFPELPMFLQNEVGGIYPTGLGVYLHHRQWYVYPLYDHTRYDKTLKTLTLINIPSKLMPEVERTYRTTANQTIVLVTGEVKHKDMSEAEMQNFGNGVRYMDSRMVLSGANEVGENKAVLTRIENTSEFITEQRPTGLNNVVSSKNRITANIYAEMSEIARRSGSELQCVWQNSNPDLIYPGMPLRYMYLKQGKVVELKGTVLAAKDYTHTYGAGYSDGRHITNTALCLFVEREPQ